MTSSSNEKVVGWPSELLLPPISETEKKKLKPVKTKCCSKWRRTGVFHLVVAIFLCFTILSTNAFQSCPAICTCKWKTGKPPQTWKYWIIPAPKTVIKFPSNNQSFLVTVVMYKGTYMAPQQVQSLMMDLILSPKSYQSLIFKNYYTYCVCTFQLRHLNFFCWNFLTF